MTSIRREDTERVFHDRDMPDVRALEIAVQRQVS